MASTIACLILLKHPELFETWMKCFTALSTVKKLSDSKYRGGVNEVTYLFLASESCEAVKKISVMVHPKMLEDLTFEEISNIVRANVRPKRNWS